MSQKDRFKTYKIANDPFYESRVVTLLIMHVLKNGKKSISQRIVYSAIEKIATKVKEDPLEIIEKAIKNVIPAVEIRSRRIGGSTYQVPTEVRVHRGISLAIRWLVKFAKIRPGKSMSLKLANELLDASKNLGNSIRKKEDTHKMAEANRAFAHYRY